MRIVLIILLTLSIAACGGRETKVADTGIHGRVQSSDGASAGKTYLSFVGQGKVVHQVADKGGRFAFDADSARAYWVVAIAPKHKPLLVPVFYDGNVGVDLLLEKDETLTDVDSLFIDGEFVEFLARGDLSRASLNGSVTFEASDSVTQIAEVQRHTQELLAQYAAAYEAHRAAGKSPDDFDYDWSTVWEALHTDIDAEQNTTVRYYKMLNFFQLGYAEADTAFARQTLADVPPKSALWTLVWGDPLTTFSTIANIAQHPGLSSTYAFYGIDTNRDPSVKAAFTFYLLTENKEIGDANLAGRFYSLLVNSFPNSSYATLAKSLYGIERDVVVGGALPDFSFTAFDDSTVVYTRDSMLGNVYMIDFWATWCGPCINEMPFLDAAYKKYGSRGFNILSVSFDEERDEVERFQRERWPMPWLNTFVDEGFWSETAEKFEIAGIPKPILVDKDGMIVAMGFDLRGKKLDETLARVFSQ